MIHLSSLQKSMLQLFLELRKAFNLVNHKILIRKQKKTRF